MRATVVMTTINNPQNIDQLIESIEEYDNIIIATDRKTPELNFKDGRIYVLSIPDQIKLCKNPIGVPFDSVPRRNMAYIYAIRYLNPDIIITIDDDNFPEKDYIIEHKNNIGRSTKPVVEQNINIVNRLLKFYCDYHENCGNVVHRGVSFEQSSSFLDTATTTQKDVNVGINAGMWIVDPDINAYDRILHPNIKSKLNDVCELVLEAKSNIYYPFNSQNTAIDKFLFPALMLVPMSVCLYDRKIGRYDDIWQSYICQKIMNKYNLSVRFGTPIVRQERNNHNIIDDLSQESAGMLHTNRFIDILKEIKLYCNSPLENMYEIADKLLVSNDKIANYIGTKIVWWLSEIK